MTKHEKAQEAIYAYTYGMDTNNWVYATSRFAREVAIDYSQVGGPRSRMSESELQEFLKNLLGKPGIKVHTAIGQVLANPDNDGEFIAYYSVRHYKGQMGKSQQFFVFGWYSYRLQEDQVTSLTINVQAIEGDPGVLS